MSSPPTTLPELLTLLWSSMENSKRGIYDAIIQGIAAERAQTWVAIGAAINNLNEKHERFRVNMRECCDMMAMLTRMALIQPGGNHHSATEMAILMFREKVVKETDEFSMLSDINEQLSSLLRNSMDAMNAMDAISATEAATAGSHDAQLRDDEQHDTTSKATEAATVDPQGGTEAEPDVNASQVLLDTDPDEKD